MILPSPYLRARTSGSNFESEAGPPIFRAHGRFKCFYGVGRRTQPSNVGPPESRTVRLSERKLGSRSMRCIYCRERAGFLRRACITCAKVVAIVDRAGGEVGLAGLVDIFVEEGLKREQVDVVL